MLRDAIEHCRPLHPFDLDASVLFPDHLHLLVTLPPDDADFSRRISLLKSTFARSFVARGGHEQLRSSSRIRQRARGIWQRRFWEHTIRDAGDLNHHFDYIHYNPVKHKYVRCPHAWPHSSFHRFVSEQRCDRDWRCQCD